MALAEVAEAETEKSHSLCYFSLFVSSHTSKPDMMKHKNRLPNKYRFCREVRSGLKWQQIEPRMSTCQPLSTNSFALR